MPLTPTKYRFHGRNRKGNFSERSQSIPTATATTLLSNFTQNQDEIQEK